MKLSEKIYNKSAVLAVIGLGYVGLPLLVQMANSGFKSIGIDINENRVNKINSGKNYIDDVNNEQLKSLVHRKLLKATTDFSILKEVDVVCIAVPTPLDKYQQPDLSYILSATKSIAKYMHKDMLVILESTTYPGTTEEIIKPILEYEGFSCGEEFYLAFSPERVDPGNLKYKTENTPKVVGGITIECTNVAALLYENILNTNIFKVSSPAVAEMEKLLENIYRNINIGLINEMTMLADKMNISIWEVIEAASTKPYGFHAFYPGPGLGGHCIPLDPQYLTWKAKEYEFRTTMIDTSMSINDNMPTYIINRISRILNRMDKSISLSKILILGVAYKKDIGDYRESPALKIIDSLTNLKGNVSFFDPYIKEYKYKGMKYKGLNEIDSQEIEEYDLIVITTDHSNVDYEMIRKHSRMIFDTRNATKNIKVRNNIELL